MSFRNRLHLLWAIVLIAPVVAVVVLAASGGSSAEQDDAQARQGLRTAFGLYAARRAEARREVVAVAADPRLRGLLVRGPSLELERGPTSSWRPARVSSPSPFAARWGMSSSRLVRGARWPPRDSRRLSPRGIASLR